MEFNIESMKASDWEQVAKIYTKGIKTKVATFQSEAPSWEDWENGYWKMA